MKKLTILIIMFLFSVSLGFAQNTKHYTIKLLEECNDELSNFGTTYYGENQVIYSSPEKGKSKIKTKKWKSKKQPYLNLYISDVQQNGELINRHKISMDVNSIFHESNVAFTNDLKTVYLSRDIDYVKKKKGKRSIAYIGIYKANVVSPTQWANVVPVFNNKDYSIGHPTLNSDNTKLYFASTISGNADIYYVDIHSDGTYGEPVNVRQVNTLSSERFPFFGDDGLLYFSSDKPGGMGDLDLYSVKLDGHSKPVNLGAPFNSNKDDFSFVKKRGADYGYFSSNRESGIGGDDIYFFKPIDDLPCNQVAEGIVTDKNTRRKIPGSLVVLYDKMGKELDSQVVGDDAKFSFKIDCSSKYKIIGSKENFSEVSKEFISYADSKPSLDLGLSKIEKIVQTPVAKPVKPCFKFAEGIVTDKNTGRRIPGALVVLYGKFGRKLETQVVGEDAKFSFKIDCSTNYKLVGSKENYLEDSKEFISNTDSELGLDLDLTIEKEIVQPPKPCVKFAEGIVTDKNTGRRIPGALVILYDNIGEELDSQVVGDDAKFSFEIDCSSKYKIISSKQGFSEVSKDFISNSDFKLGLDLGLSKVKEVVQPPITKKPIKPCVKFAEGFVTDKKTGGRIPGALVVLYGQFGKELESQVVGNDAKFSFKIDCSSNYKVVGSKENYLEDSKEFVSNTNSELGLDLDLSIEKKVVQPVKPIVQHVSSAVSSRVASVTSSQYDNCQNALDLINNIYFDLNKSYIRYDAASELSKVVKIMKRCPNIHVEASSHTDSRGPNVYNEVLSQQRAKSVVDFIVNYGGIDSSRINGIGYGESRLRNRCSDGVKCSEAEHLINRRTEFEITNY